MNKFLKYLPYAVLFLCLVFVLGYRLWYPPDPFFDEMHYVKFVHKIIYENTHFWYANQHPPLWHLLMALSIGIFGDHSFAWRLPSFLAHLGVILVTFRIAFQLTGNKTFAWMSCFLLVFDCLSLTQARIAMMNSTMLLFVLLSISFFLDTFPRNEIYNHQALRRSGIFWAFAIATKMISANLLFFFAPLLFMEFRRRKAERWPIAKDLAIYFLLFPFLLFICVHIFLPFLESGKLSDIWTTWIANIKYHSTMTATHNYGSRWWSWPLLLRPICFYFKGIFWNSPSSTVEIILAIGNPVLFWSIPLVMGYMIWAILRQRSRAAAVIVLGFLSQWLTFALGSRLQFFHYFYAAMPFVAMATAYVLWQMYLSGKWGRILTVGFLVAVAAMFVYWYPLLTAMPLKHHYYYQHMWFRSWI